MIRIMDKLLAKISSYNIFNFLVPGLIFVYLVNFLTALHIPVSETWQLLIVAYFIGLVLSRIGSLILEPLFETVKLLPKKDYSKYVEIEKNDPKLSILLEQRNTYRTMCAMILAVLLIRIFEDLILEAVSKSAGDWYLMIFIFILLIAAFRKQTQYITDRINV